MTSDQYIEIFKVVFTDGREFSLSLRPWMIALICFLVGLFVGRVMLGGNS